VVAYLKQSGIVRFVPRRMADISWDRYALLMNKDMKQSDTVSKSKDTDKKHHQCNQPQCGRVFGTNYTLRRHQKLVHGMELPPSTKGPRARYTTEELKVRNVRGVQRYRLRKQMRQQLDKARNTPVSAQPDAMPLPTYSSPQWPTLHSTLSLEATTPSRPASFYSPCSKHKMSLSFLLRKT
jgi:hypothetical protein